MNGYDLANGVVLAIGCACAFGVPRVTRSATVALACAMALTWGLYVWTYADSPPQVWLRSHGFQVQAYHLWLIADATVGLLGICAGIVGLSGSPNEGWWGWAIWGLTSAMLAAHSSKWEMGVLEQGQYYRLLDGLFLASVATLILAGGGGVVRYIGIRLRDLRRLHGVGRGNLGSTPLVAEPLHGMEAS